MSRQAAWEYYTRETRHVVDESAVGSDLYEDEAMWIVGDAGPLGPERSRAVGGIFF